MNSFKEIVGNDSIISSLIKTIKDNNTLHAYIICSSDKITRTEVGMAFAKSMMCTNFADDACLDCISCRTFDSMNNPDVKIIKRNVENGKQKESIMVDQIREVVNDANVKPYSNKNKIYIIDEADTMNASAQNALLKTLEEPNDFTKIILLVSNIKNMLPTILSRCIVLKLNPLRKDELKKWASEHNISNENIDCYVNYAMGNVTSLVDILENKEFMEKREEILSITEKVTSFDIDDMLYVKEYLINEKDNIDMILDTLEIWYRDIMFMRKNLKDKVINLDKLGKLEKESKDVKLSVVEKVLTSITNLRKKLVTNVNYKILIEVFQINIREV